MQMARVEARFRNGKRTERVREDIGGKPDMPLATTAAGARERNTLPVVMGAGG